MSQTGFVVKRYPLESIVSVGCLRSRVEALSPTLRDRSTNLVVGQETSFTSPLIIEFKLIRIIYILISKTVIIILFAHSSSGARTTSSTAQTGVGRAHQRERSTVRAHAEYDVSGLEATVDVVVDGEIDVELLDRLRRVSVEWRVRSHLTIPTTVIVLVKISR